MLRWESTPNGYDEYDGFAGEERVAAIYVDGRQFWRWHLISGWIGKGQSNTLEAAKSAAEEAFKAWCERAALTALSPALQVALHNLQAAIDFHDRVNVASEDMKIAVRDDGWTRLEAAARKVAMLAAAPKSGTGKELSSL